MTKELFTVRQLRALKMLYSTLTTSQIAETRDAENVEAAFKTIRRKLESVEMAKLDEMEALEVIGELHWTKKQEKQYNKLQAMF
jgi:hypothetical protein